MICTSCGRDNPDEVTYCLDCGRKLSLDESSPPPGSSTENVVCPKCGAENPPTMNFCKRCGSPLSSSEPSPLPVQGSEGEIAPKICERCQGVLDQDAQFCKYCGMSLGQDQAGPEQQRSHLGQDLQLQGVPSGKTGPLGGAPSVQSGRARLVAILKDGSEGQTYPLSGEPTDIGRKEGNILLPDDPYLSPRHARLTEQNGRYFLKDLATTNGIFVRLRDKCRLHHGEVVLVGQQVLRFEIMEESERGLGPASQHGTLVFGTPEGVCIGRLCQLTTEGIVRDIYHIKRKEVVIGREGPDIVFPDDPFMSRRHAKLNYDEGNRTFILEDLGSFNGTSLRFRGERELQSGDQFRVGNHLFLFETGGVER